MNKISVQEFQQFILGWVGTGKLRFGQAFLQKFFPNIRDPDIYYEPSAYIARNIISERYVQYD